MVKVSIAFAQMSCICGTYHMGYVITCVYTDCRLEINLSHVLEQKSKSIDTDIDIPLQQCNLELDLVSTSRPALCVYAECISGGGHETSGHNVETKVITPCMHKEVDKH